MCIRQSAEVFASLFSILFGKSGADISFYQSTTTLALLCQAQVQGSGPNLFSINLCVTKFDFHFSSRLHALKVNIQPSMIDEDNANFWSAQSCVGPGSAQLSAKSEDTEFDGSFYLSVHGIYGENEIDSAAT